MTDKDGCPKCGRIEGGFYIDPLSSPVKIITGKYGTMCRRCQYNASNANWSRNKRAKAKEVEKEKQRKLQEAHGQLSLWGDDL